MNKKYGCLGIIICFGIVTLLISPFVDYIGDAALPIIVIGGGLLAKATESIWFKK